MKKINTIYSKANEYTIITQKHQINYSNYSKIAINFYKIYII